MMVCDMMNNKTAPTIATASPKLDAGEKKAPKRSGSSKRASDSLKRNMAKDLASPKPRSRSPISSPPGRSASTKSTSKKGSKDKKEKKKKSKSSSLQGSSTHSTKSASSKSSQSSQNKTKRRKSSKSSKKTMQDALAAAVLLGGSEHTKSTEHSDSTADSKEITVKVITEKSKKPLKKSSSSKATKKEKSSSPPAVVDQPPVSPSRASPGPVRNRLLSFESIHGRSVHKNTKTRRCSGNAANAGKFIETLAPPPPSPQQLSSPFGSPPSAGGRKTSVLKVKKEKQEMERRASIGKNTTASPGTSLPVQVQRNKEDYIDDVLDIVHSYHNPKARGMGVPFCNHDNFNDPDECSSQSSCSVVSDGSYEKDDLLSHASERSDERDSKFHTGSLLDDIPSFGEHSFTIDSEHELSPTKLCSSKKVLAGPSNPLVFSPDGQPNMIGDIFKETLMAEMASSMSALHEINEDEEPHPSPAPSAMRSVPNKSLLKVSAPPATPNSAGKPPLRLVPKRAKSDITSLSSGINSMANNLLRVRLPGQRKTVTRQRSLTFNEKVRVKRVPCQAQACEGDTSELWFQPQEYDAIKRKTMALIRAVQDDQTGGVTYCTRGLERYFSVEAVQDKRNNAWDSVLDEQEAQRSNCETFNPDRIARTYSQTNRLSIKEAVERGKLDEDAIARYTKKMRQTLRRTYSNAV